jgi:hypothetical protein
MIADCGLTLLAAVLAPRCWVEAFSVFTRCKHRGYNDL